MRSSRTVRFCTASILCLFVWFSFCVRFVFHSIGFVSGCPTSVPVNRRKAHRLDQRQPHARFCLHAALPSHQEYHLLNHICCDRAGVAKCITQPPNLWATTLVVVDCGADAGGARDAGGAGGSGGAAGAGGTGGAGDTSTRKET